MASNDAGQAEATLRSPNDDSTTTSTTQPSMKEIIEQKRLKAVAELARRKALAAAAAASSSLSSSCSSSSATLNDTLNTSNTSQQRHDQDCQDGGKVGKGTEFTYDPDVAISTGSNSSYDRNYDSNNISNSNYESNTSYIPSNITIGSYCNSNSNINNSNTTNSNSSDNTNSDNNTNSNTSSNSSSKTSGNINMGCQALLHRSADGEERITCGSMNLDDTMQRDFDELVCLACRNANPAYDILSKSQILKEYLISGENLLGFKFISRDNPKNKHWTQMKMYLRKPCEEQALKRFGSIENLKEECQKRERQAFERESSNINQSLGFHNNESSQGSAAQVDAKRRKITQTKKIEDLLNCLN